MCAPYVFSSDFDVFQLYVLVLLFSWWCLFTRSMGLILAHLCFLDLLKVGVLMLLFPLSGLNFLIKFFLIQLLLSEMTIYFICLFGLFIWWYYLWSKISSGPPLLYLFKFLSIGLTKIWFSSSYVFLFPPWLLLHGSEVSMKLNLVHGDLITVWTRAANERNWVE